MAPHPSADDISVRVGLPFTIRLHSNPSTGYAWQAIYDASLVDLVSQAVDPAAPNIGSGGDEVLTFRALKPGAATITLELRRPWEKGARESRQFQVTAEP